MAAPLNVKGLCHKHVSAQTSESGRKSRKPQERVSLTFTLVRVAVGQAEDRDCHPHSSATTVLQQMSSRLANAAQGPFGSARLQQAAGRKTSRLFGKRLSSLAPGRALFVL